MVHVYCMNQIPDEVVSTDGWGCGWGNQWLQCQWVDKWKERSIAVKKMLLLIVLAIPMWGQQWCYQLVLNVTKWQ